MTRIVLHRIMLKTEITGSLREIMLPRFREDSFHETIVMELF